MKATRDKSKKRCPRCGETKLISEFRNEPARPRGLAIYCRACDPAIRREKYLARKHAHNDYAKRYRQERPVQSSEYSRRHSLKKNYGITAQQWDEMFTRQNGCCLLCGEPSTSRRLDVDHCHDTGRVRGLLCSGCNAGIALLKHDPVLLAKAIAYLSGELVAALWK